MAKPSAESLLVIRRHSTSAGARYVDSDHDDELHTTPALARISLIDIPQLASPIARLRELHRKARMEYEDQLAELKVIEEKGEWSGIGEKYDVDFDRLDKQIQEQLKAGTDLGNGGFGRVTKVVCRQITMANKSIRVERQSETLKRIKRESKHAQNLDGHTHITKIVGTYLVAHSGGEETFHILSFPVAHMDLNKFLSECEMLGKLNSSAPTTRNVVDRINYIMERLAIAAAVDVPGPQEMRSAIIPATFQNFLKNAIGCLANAISWMHSKGIYHHDLKPENVLVHNGRIFVTDFGVSRDRSEALTSRTDYIPRGTQLWSPPEIRFQQNNTPSKADVYSLGLLFLHLVTVAYGRKTMKDCFILHWSDRREKKIKEHFQVPWRYIISFKLILKPDDSWPPQNIVELIKFMVKEDQDARPSIKDVNALLVVMGGQESAYHGKCCYRSCNELDVSLEWRKKMKDYITMPALSAQPVELAKRPSFRRALKGKTVG